MMRKAHLGMRDVTQGIQSEGLRVRSDFGEVGNSTFSAMLKFISQEVPMERATRCFSELTKGRKQPAYVCKWKHQSKHGASALQGLSPCTLPSTREWCRATEAKSSRERAGTATSSTGQLRVAMGSLTAPPGLFSVGSGPTCGICRPNVGAAGCFTFAKSSVCRWRNDVAAL